MWEEKVSKKSIIHILRDKREDISMKCEGGFLISPCYSLELCIQMLISFLSSFAFHFSSFHSYL